MVDQSCCKVNGLDKDVWCQLRIDHERTVSFLFVWVSQRQRDHVDTELVFLLNCNPVSSNRATKNELVIRLPSAFPPPCLIIFSVWDI